MTDLGTWNFKSYGHFLAGFNHAATQPSGFVPTVRERTLHMCVYCINCSLSVTHSCSLSVSQLPLCLQSLTICCLALCERVKLWFVFRKESEHFS